jgi:hypothetical protein
MIRLPSFYLSLFSTRFGLLLGGLSILFCQVCVGSGWFFVTGHTPTTSKSPPSPTPQATVPNWATTAPDGSPASGTP